MNFVEADAAQFETALVNMAVNARDAMDGEGLLASKSSCSQSVPSQRGHAGTASRRAGIQLFRAGYG